MRGRIHKDEAGRRIEVGTRFVHGDVAFPTDTHQYNVHSTECLQTLFVQAAIFNYRFLCDASVDGKHILLVDVNLVD